MHGRACADTRAVSGANRSLDVQPVIDWLIEGPPSIGDDPKRLLGTFCEQMLACGLPAARVAIFARPLHPNVAARAYYWREADRRVEMNEEGHAFVGSDEHLSSPIERVRRTGASIRRRLADPNEPDDFPVLAELREQGLTDYLIQPLRFIDGEIHGFSVATRQAGGFSDAEIDAIRRVTPALTRLVEILSWTRKAGYILDAYLGPHTGARVLQGRIRRGDTEALHAVIWFCDLRDSTRVAEAIGASAFAALLNDYFDAVLAPVIERGGEVLSFIGDAALAIFPVGAQPEQASKRAVDAARDAIARIDALNERRLAEGSMPLRFGIGIHVGEFLYGNVGTQDRITFTVIGPAANEAARIEALCKTLGVSPLVSEHVARHVPLAWRSLGRQSLRGVGQPIELFTF
jgi:adenylate cyclase